MQAGADHPVARRHSGYPLPRRQHPARRFRPRNERQVGAVLVFAFDHQQIGEVQPHRLHSDQHLPGLRHRVVKILIGQVLQRTELVYHLRFHLPSLH